MVSNGEITDDHIGPHTALLGELRVRPLGQAAGRARSWRRTSGSTVRRVCSASSAPYPPVWARAALHASR
ncbi:hypothetical protein [Streptomyces collinus]|uniref:hypothetical protein n=1 Tax=Streptomyces collinus TaxID=42684 RepID=UPI0029436F59|nr:hypothetical protein [Streptomyces collinus]